MKKLSFIVLLLTLCISANAQDKIFLRDGTVLKAKVKEVGPRQIIYRKWDNQDGPDYVVTRREVESIRYENGTEEVIESRGATDRRRDREARDNEDSDSGNTRRKDDDDGDAPRAAVPRRGADREPTLIQGYGRNILAIAPIQMTNESPAGVGIQYERILDRNQMFSLYLPVAISFFTDETDISSQTKQRSFAYLYPGIKIYPAGSAHRVSYSIGASVAFGFGTKYKTAYEDKIDSFGNHYTQTSYSEGSVFKSGFILNNGLNIQPTKRLYLGLEFGIGFLYSNNESSDFTIGNEPLVQFNFKFGYRF